MRAKKSLGQNFLKNKGKLRKVAGALELREGDFIIEIGPGHGELTQELGIRNQELGTNVIAIEKDRELISGLWEKFKNCKNFGLVEGDALKALPELIKKYKLKDRGYKLVGNIPYYITGYLLRVIGDSKKKPERVVLTIQKEVAKRICAKDGMNLLAASVQFWAEPKIVDYISKRDFSPVPKVDSAIIKLATYKSQPATGEAERYYKFIKALFKQPRKTILNNLIAGIANNELGIIDKEDLIKMLEQRDIRVDARPGDLSLEQIVDLSKNLEGK